jgi:hypothetical protein
LLVSRYSRIAWLVPVRGVLPWAECTSAVLLDQEEDSNPGSDAQYVASSILESRVNKEMVWTQPAVCSFWEFLLQLREAGVLGPLALSFQPAVEPPPSLTPTPAPPYSLTGLATPPEEPAQASQRSLHFNSRTGDDPRSTLRKADYIKITLDAPFALYVRNALDAWWFSESDSSGQSHALPGHIKKRNRILRGAKLVVVDEQGQGVLTC